MEWSKDHPGKTEQFWKVDFSRYEETIDRDPRATIFPDRGEAGTAEFGALRVLERLFARDGSLPGVRFELFETIGTGGSGVVRKAKQTALGRDVAVKSIRSHKRTEAAIRDLLHEAWITGSLEHPNIVPVHDIILDKNGDPLIVLKRIEGVSWSQLIGDAGRVHQLFGVEDLLEWNLGILLQVLNAVRFAHSRGIIHRDIKPDNVMIGQFGEVYVVDWGLAVSLRNDETGRLPLAARATSLAGTPCYMAPEMLGDSEYPITERTDIYLVGSVLHEILTGHPPHMGRDAMAIIGSVVTSNPEFPADAPEGLVRICRRAMDPDPDGRFENTEQVQLAIQGFLRNRGSERLGRQAETTLSELETQLARAVKSDRKIGSKERSELDSGELSSSPSAHRQRLYRLFGACRFGFREALAAWHGNYKARAGLQRAIVAMIEYELAQGDQRAAAALYAELPDPLEDLHRRIQQAIEFQAAEKRRAAELERLGQQLDIRVGQRARALATLVLGLSFTIVPTICTWQWPFTAFDNHPKLIVWTAIFGVFTLAVGYRIRRSLRESAANRRLFSLLLLLIAAEFPLQVGLWSAGFTADESLLVHEFVWFFLAAIIAVTFDLRLLPAAFGYLVTFFIMAVLPESRLYIFNVPHGLLTINYVLAWRSL
ncbi:MAG: protein kinase [Proteobacteria bacterium]|nr:protein kinase [Pseudomonadota bacterium]